MYQVPFDAPSLRHHCCTQQHMRWLCMLACSKAHSPEEQKQKAKLQQAGLEPMHQCSLAFHHSSCQLVSIQAVQLNLMSLDFSLGVYSLRLIVLPPGKLRLQLSFTTCFFSLFFFADLVALELLLFPLPTGNFLVCPVATGRNWSQLVATG